MEFLVMELSARNVLGRSGPYTINIKGRSSLLLSIKTDYYSGYVSIMRTSDKCYQVHYFKRHKTMSLVTEELRYSFRSAAELAQALYLMYIGKPIDNNAASYTDVAEKRKKIKRSSLNDCKKRS